MTRYAVVQEKLQVIEPELLQSILVSEAGILRADAARIARKSRGVLSDRLTLQQAADVCGALQVNGYAVRALPADQLAPLSKAKAVRWIGLHDDHLGLPLGYQGETHRITWTSVFVISAGQVSELHEKVTFEPVNYHTPERGSETKVHRRSVCTHVTEVIAMSDNGQFLHVRLPSHEMAYDRFLGAHAGLNMFEKYLLMVELLVQRSTSALVSPETLQLLEDRKQLYESTEGDTAHYTEERDFAEYNRWLLQMVIFRELG